MLPGLPGHQGAGHSITPQDPAATGLMASTDVLRALTSAFGQCLYQLLNIFNIHPDHNVNLFLKRVPGAQKMR